MGERGKMGSVISSRVKDDGKVIFEICVDREEALQLKGHLDNVHVFSENVNDLKTNMVQRGKNDSTRYFLIPRELRSNLGWRDKALCQKVETKTKMIFIYIINKLKI